MSYYTVTVKEIYVIGKIWMPAITCAQTIKVTDHDIENMKDNGELTRDSIENWLGCHTGDFQSIIDFSVDIADFQSPWADPDSEFIFMDCIYPELMEV